MNKTLRKFIRRIAVKSQMKNSQMNTLNEFRATMMKMTRSAKKWSFVSQTTVWWVFNDIICIHMHYIHVLSWRRFIFVSSFFRQFPVKWNVIKHTTPNYVRYNTDPEQSLNSRHCMQHTHKLAKIVRKSKSYTHKKEEWEIKEIRR